MSNLQATFQHPLALINIFGVSNVGKTDTLKALYDLVKTDPSFNQIDFYQFNGADFKIIFEYKGVRVGIITMGDPGCETEVRDFLNDCLINSCSRIFTASRTRGSMFGIVINFASLNGYAFIETSPLYMRFRNGYNGGFSFLQHTFASMLESLI